MAGATRYLILKSVCTDPPRPSSGIGPPNGTVPELWCERNVARPHRRPACTPARQPTCFSCRLRPALLITLVHGLADCQDTHCDRLDAVFVVMLAHRIWRHNPHASWSWSLPSQMAMQASSQCGCARKIARIVARNTRRFSRRVVCSTLRHMPVLRRQPQLRLPPQRASMLPRS